MGWEQRGTNSYYYRKVREGSRVTSVYLGKGEVANLIAKFQSTSHLVEGRDRSIETIKQEQAETALEQATDLIQMMTQAALLTAGFHTHHRQWRRKRSLSAQRENESNL